MAEGWARHLLGDRIEPCSAGIEAHGMNPNAVKVMQHMDFCRQAFWPDLDVAVVSVSEQWAQ